MDESAEMLARVVRAETHLSAIEDLRLHRRFDVVMMLSCLVNTPDETRRAALLETAVRHLNEGGLLIVQRHDPVRRWQPGHAQAGDVEVELSDVDVDRWPLVGAVTHYRVGAQSWAQPWTARILDDQAMGDALTPAGLSGLTVEGAWVTAERR